MYTDQLFAKTSTCTSSNATPHRRASLSTSRTQSTSDQLPHAVVCMGKWKLKFGGSSSGGKCAGESMASPTKTIQEGLQSCQVVKAREPPGRTRRMLSVADGGNGLVIEVSLGGGG